MADEYIVANKATTNSTTYVTVFEFTSPNEKLLAEILALALSPDTVAQTYARYRLTINGEEKFVDAQIDVDWALDIGDNPIKSHWETSILKLEHKTTDAGQTVGTTYSYRIRHGYGVKP